MQEIQPGATVSYDDGTDRFVGTVAMNIGGDMTVFAGNKIYNVASDSPYLQEEPKND